MKHHQFQKFLHYQKGKLMSDMMTFPATVEEFMEQYKIVDSEKIYTNGADLIPIFRMMQWFEHISAMDTISRQAAIDAIISFFKLTDYNESAYAVRTVLGDLPPAQSESNYDEWCTDCKEYDKEKHSCPRWNRVIRQTLQDAQPEPEPCEDAVSRKDCLQALSHLMDVEGFRDGWAVSRANVECMLKAMPPVTLKQRTGYWYPVGMAEVVGGESAQWGSAVAYHKCSECDGQALMDDFEQEVLSEFCPHCGAKMVGVSG